MLSRRSWFLRFSVVLNIAVLFYFGSHLASRRGSLELMEESAQASSRNLASYDAVESSAGNEALNLNLNPSADFFQSIRPLYDGTTLNPGNSQNGTISTTLKSNSNSSDSMRSLHPKDSSSPNSIINTSNKTTKANINSNTNSVTNNTSLASEPTTPRGDVLKDIIHCDDKTPRHYISQRGDFWVLHNYVMANKVFHCYESITYTTHADYSFLDNLEPLIERWRGPISLAIHAPGTDFVPTLNTINYLKSCSSPLVNDFVTFHIYFNSHHLPKFIPKPQKLFSEPYNCSLPPPYVNVSSSSMYKGSKKILYPVNVGRNIAREAANTFYVLASDIELYPSPGVIPDFLQMVRRQDPPLLRKNPKVFPLSIFEIEANMSVPKKKSELVAMLKNGTAIPFHKKVCPGCHNVPKSKEWMEKGEKSPGLHVFHIGKRTGQFIRWEPIYIGTHADPPYDERLHWEGKSDKMTQGYALCALDYEFQILDNAFLVHKPGIKTLKKNPARDTLTRKTNSLIQKVIWPELKILYGIKKGCSV